MADLRTAVTVMLVMLTGPATAPESTASRSRELSGSPISTPAAGILPPEPLWPAGPRPVDAGPVDAGPGPAGPTDSSAAADWLGSGRTTRITVLWPDPDVRAGLRTTARTGVRTRFPRTRPRGPACAVPRTLTSTVNRTRPEQILLVTATGTRARVSGCERTEHGYVRVLGPFPARVGRRGVAPPGDKREGDGRTPSGIFRLGTGFGIAKNPGLAPSFGWSHVGRRDVWVDDPSSRLYNTPQRGPADGRWRSAEKLRIKPYRIAQVIEYNRGRTPGRGSAIFLHLATGRPTAGCVSLPAGALRAVMSWERAEAVIAIA